MLELNKIYCGDCLDLMREMPDKSVDLVLTDPPYGINGFGDRIDKTFKINEWDHKPEKEYFNELFRVSRNQIIFGWNYFDLPPTPCFLIWDKEQPENFSFAMCEAAWTSFKSPAQMFHYRAVGHGIVKEHPTQKPLPLMMWCLEKYSKEGMTVLDPFMGSGTTCVACKKLGRNFIGIEKEPAYVEIALKRLEKVNNHKITDFFGVGE
jgi:DNA modification methylase